MIFVSACPSIARVMMYHISKRASDRSILLSYILALKTPRHAVVLAWILDIQILLLKRPDPLVK